MFNNIIIINIFVLFNSYRGARNRSTLEKKNTNNSTVGSVMVEWNPTHRLITQHEQKDNQQRVMIISWGAGEKESELIEPQKSFDPLDLIGRVGLIYFY